MSSYLDFQKYRLLALEEHALLHIPLSGDVRLGKGKLKTLIENHLIAEKVSFGENEDDTGVSYVYERLSEEVEVFAFPPASVSDKRKQYVLPVFSLSKGVVKSLWKAPETDEARIGLLCASINGHTVHHAVDRQGKTLYFDFSGKSEKSVVSTDRIISHLEGEFNGKVELVEAQGELTDYIGKAPIPASLFTRKKRDLYLKELLCFALIISLAFMLKTTGASFVESREIHSDTVRLSRKSQRLNSTLASVEATARELKSLPKELKNSWDPLKLLRKISDEIYVDNHSWIEYFELDRSCGCIRRLSINLYDRDTRQLKKMAQNIRDRRFKGYRLKVAIVPIEGKDKPYVIRLDFSLSNPPAGPARERRVNTARNRRASTQAQRKGRNGNQKVVKRGKKKAAVYQHFPGGGARRNRRITKVLPGKVPAVFGRNGKGNADADRQNEGAVRKADAVEFSFPKIFQFVERELFGESVARAAESPGVETARNAVGFYKADKSATKKADKSATKKADKFVRRAENPGEGRTNRGPSQRPYSLPRVDDAGRQRAPSGWDAKEASSLLQSLEDNGQIGATLHDRGGGSNPGRIVNAGKFSDTSFKDFMHNPFEKPQKENKKADIEIIADDTEASDYRLVLVGPASAMLQEQRDGETLILTLPAFQSDEHRSLRLVRCEPTKGAAAIQMGGSIKTFTLNEPFAEWEVEF